jgi:hypothetical protein
MSERAGSVNTADTRELIKYSPVRCIWRDITNAVSLWLGSWVGQRRGIIRLQGGSRRWGLLELANLAVQTTVKLQ